jgi:hypothetical protein
MRCWSRRTLRWMLFHRSARQSSVRRLLSLLLALLATPAQDLNSAGPSIFPHTGLTSAYPRHYSGHLLLEPSLPSGYPAWSPAPIAGRTVDGLLRSVCPFSVAVGRHCTPRLSYRVGTTCSAVSRGRMETFPIWACVLFVHRQRAAISQILTHDACVPSSKILTIATCSRRHRSRLAVYPLSPLALRRLMASLPP